MKRPDLTKSIMRVVESNPKHKVNIQEPTQILSNNKIDKCQEEEVPYTRMLMNKCIKSDRVRKLPIGNHSVNNCYRNNQMATLEKVDKREARCGYNFQSLPTRHVLITKEEY